MILAIGEILFDVFPDYRRIGGAPFNFAYHLMRLGFPVRFISRIGRDSDGESILDMLQSAGFDTQDIQIDDQRPTGTVKVEVDENGQPGFTILTDVAYEYIAVDDAVRSAIHADPKLIYFGNLIQRSRTGFSALQSLLNHRRPETVCFCDMNLRPDCYTRDTVIHCLEKSDLLKLSEEELDITRRLTGRTESGEGFIRWLMETYTITTLAVTRGAGGSELYRDGMRVAAPASPAKEIVDTVGAGDAYAAMLAAGHLRGWPAETIISCCARFARRICEIPGAIPTTDSLYEEFREIGSEGDW